MMIVDAGREGVVTSSSFKPPLIDILGNYGSSGQAYKGVFLSIRVFFWKPSA